MEKIFIFDTSNLVYRSFFGFAGRHLTNSKGEITSAIFGTLRTVIKLYKDFRFENAVFSLDGPREQTKRFKIYNSYKITREKAPEDLKSQFRKTVNLLREAGIECIEIPGYESDDIIASITKKLSGKYQIYVVSGDKDLFQLLAFPNVRIVSFSPAKAEYRVIDRTTFIEENGFEPEYIVDYLALVGDNIDNIPGARGIGEKTAKPLISKYKTVENIYSHLDEIEPNVRKKLVESQSDVLLSKKLVQLFFDENLDISITKFSLENFAKPRVIELLKEYEFRSILNELQLSKHSNNQELSLFSQEPQTTTQVMQKARYKIATTFADLDRIRKEILQEGIVSLDIETDEKHFMECNIIGFAISTREYEGYYLPILHKVKKEFSESSIISFLKEICENQDIKKIGHNIKYDYVVLKRYGIELKNIFFDTMIASYVLRPEFTHHNLDRLAEEYLNYRTIRYEEVTKKQQSLFTTLLDVPIEDVAIYSCEDADITLRLYNLFSKKLNENTKLRELFYYVEMPLVRVLGDMEFNGVKVDTSYLVGLGEELKAEIEKVSNTVFDTVGETFNLNSPKQVSYILFEKMKLPTVKKTKTGYSTDEEVLEELAQDYEIAQSILKYRTLVKLKTTYVDELPSMVIRSTGRIHTSFNQTVTATGRLSSSNPNLQNIPVRDEIGKKIRTAFIAEEGKVLGSFDYSQIELRVLAHVSEDEVLINQFYEGRDIHSETASKILGIRPEEITPEHRRIGKTINFGIVYGISAYGLSKQLKVSTSEANEIINRYFANYKKVKEYIFNTLEFVSKNGYVETMFGRRRNIPELSNKKYDRSKITLGKSERIAINTPIQGSAAEIVKIAMNRLWETLLGSPVKMLLQVHDEILVELPEDEVERYQNVIKTTLENAVTLKVPLIVEHKFGKNWGEIH
ncbi:MAG: DNA polymerase I [Brevinematia bacterium]